MLTYVTDVQGDEPDILTARRYDVLIIRTLDGNVLLRKSAPEGGWTHKKLMENQPANTEEGADAFLGEHWVGSTEV